MTKECTHFHLYNMGLVAQEQGDLHFRRPTLYGGLIMSQELWWQKKYSVLYRGVEQSVWENPTIFKKPRDSLVRLKLYVRPSNSPVPPTDLVFYHAMLLRRAVSCGETTWDAAWLEEPHFDPGTCCCLRPRRVLIRSLYLQGRIGLISTNVL